MSILLLARECAELPRSWPSSDSELLADAVALLARHPRHPALLPGAVRDDPSLLTCRVGGSRLLIYSRDTATRLWGILDRGVGPGGGPDAATVKGFLSTDVAILEPGQPARPALSSSDRAHQMALPFDEMGPFACTPTRELRDCGVPRELIDALRRLQDVSLLGHLGLTDETRRNLELRFMLHRPAELQTVPEVLRYRVPDVETLRRFYAGDLRSLLLNLNELQNELVHLKEGGPILVNGVPGSGKTTVALYRVRHLLIRHSRARVLFVCYNRALSQSAAALVRELLPQDGQQPPTVLTLHKWAQLLLKRHGHAMEVVKESRREEFLAEAISENRLRNSSEFHELNPKFLAEEIREVIKGQAEGDLERYMSASRRGRRTRLSPARRKVVWMVYETYQARLRQSGLRDFDDVLLDALRLTRSGLPPTELFDHVFVDEAQDLPLTGIELCTRLCRHQPPSIVFLADAAQAIYRKGFRWKDIEVEGRVRRLSLTVTYRATRQILALANAVLDSGVAPLSGTEPLVVGKATREGPVPRLVSYRSEAAEIAGVAEELRRVLTSQGVAPANVAVLSPTRELLTQLGAHLSRLGIPFQLVTPSSRMDVFGPSVKLLTLHSAKGLEFPVVYMIGLSQHRIPMLPRRALPDDERLEHLQQGRRLLYVGITRAMQDLTLTCVAHQRSELLDGLASDLVRHSPA